MNNTFTPEDANMPVTYGELLKIFQPVFDEIAKCAIDYSNTLQEQTFKIIDTLTEHIVAIRDDAEYKRQRDIRFVLGYLSRLCGCDKDRMHNEYKHWCEEFDKLNRPKTNSEDTNGQEAVRIYKRIP